MVWPSSMKEDEADGVRWWCNSASFFFRLAWQHIEWYIALRVECFLFRLSFLFAQKYAKSINYLTWVKEETETWLFILCYLWENINSDYVSIMINKFYRICVVERNWPQSRERVNKMNDGTFEYIYTRLMLIGDL